MKFFIVLAVAVAAAHADVSQIAEPGRQARILRNDYDQTPEGEFRYQYETENDIQVEARGVLINRDTELPSLSISGTVSYTAPDGTPISWSYVAGPNGYQAVGDIIPTSPPIPEMIARSLAYIAARPPPTAAAPAPIPVRASATLLG